MGRPSQVFGEKTENRLVTQQVHSKRDMNTTKKVICASKDYFSSRYCNYVVFDILLSYGQSSKAHLQK